MRRCDQSEKSANQQQQKADIENPLSAQSGINKKRGVKETHSIEIRLSYHIFISTFPMQDFIF